MPLGRSEEKIDHTSNIEKTWKVLDELDPSSHRKPSDKVVTALGLTGVGKSTFLNFLVSRDTLECFATSGGQKSCTKNVQAKTISVSGGT